MIKLQLKYCGLPVLLCSSVLMSACDRKPDTVSQSDKIQLEDKVMQELITEPVKTFPQTPDDQHDIALLTDFDQRFSQMSDEMEDELVKMEDQGTLTDEFAYNRKRDNIYSALTMLKELDLKTEQGRYIQGLMAEYWQNQAKFYDENKEKTAEPIKNSADQTKGLGEFLHAQEQLEHWQSQYPDMNQAQAKKAEAAKSETTESGY
ncbi:hypothetical protein H0920_00735 [Acinetobacter sp. C_4_1]|uniref:hypothetical protein n=1 Tax=unclassified Acinetobacter TaxID=196816 RepID=UPI0021B73769|nr:MULTISPECIES: hypothetical protein [unclassified Acinetobacter]MCT8088621.1 hypothetical protein [Acinetobacter sp. F_3_1]MCT8096777.1 hypothetical protein [Acinetobacter sp. C_3_1]MCT8099652.1 hypothetical protein [Acinetobacter sp. C_4_1]MCT8133620.1 hypothetical protein [Acinetobacter sp. T_3_1]